MKKILLLITCAFISISGVRAVELDEINQSGLSAKEKQTQCESNAYSWDQESNLCIKPLTYVKCGDAYDIPSEAPRIISLVIVVFKTGAPLILIIAGMITLIKAILANKDDEVRKAKSALVRKIIAAVLVFFVVSIVQLLISLVADEKEIGSFTSCLNCFMNNDCEATKYYKTNVGGEYQCTLIESKVQESCTAFYKK